MGPEARSGVLRHRGGEHPCRFGVREDASPTLRGVCPWSRGARVSGWLRVANHAIVERTAIGDHQRGGGAVRVTIRIPAALRPVAEDRAEVVVQAETVGSALTSAVECYPSLRRHLFDERGRLRSYVNIYLNEDDIRWGGGETAPVDDGDVVTIVPSIAGG